MTTLRIDHLESPVGEVTLVAHGDTLVALDFFAPDRMRDRLVARYPDARFVDADDPAALTSRLRAYFAGTLDALAALPVDPGGTAFQQQVWKALQQIPCGETRSYRDIAEAVGSPRAMRAVGSANGRNPIGIVIPCHRVVNADRGLGGYSGGLDNKRWLLAHEGVSLG